jgi:hypothetical protein
MLNTTTAEIALCIEDAHRSLDDGSCELMEEHKELCAMLEECEPFHWMIVSALRASNGDGNSVFALVFLLGIKTGQMIDHPEIAGQRPAQMRNWPGWRELLILCLPGFVLGGMLSAVGFNGTHWQFWAVTVPVLFVTTITRVFFPPR